jgi:hypothetical protein
VPHLDLRSICAQPPDYANDIEPVGGAKIANAIVLAVARLVSIA